MSGVAKQRPEIQINHAQIDRCHCARNARRHLATSHHVTANIRTRQNAHQLYPKAKLASQQKTWGGKGGQEVMPGWHGRAN
ncbi:hypothetical protein NQZ68_016857, partial [Dissostichus eleginoides]